MKQETAMELLEALEAILGAYRTDLWGIRRRG